MRFSLVKTAFAGFRLIAARQWSFLAWFGLVMVAIALVFVAAAPLPRASVAADRPPWGPMAAALVILTVLAAVLVCAVYRAELRPDDRRFAYLRLGADEARMVPLLGAGMLVLLLGSRAAPWGWAVALSVIVLGSRATLVAPAIFARKRFDLAFAWRIAEGRYRALLGLNLITWIIYATSMLVLQMAWRAFMSASHRDLLAMVQSGERLMTAQLAVACILWMLLYTALFVVVVAPAAAAYRACLMSAPTSPQENFPAPEASATPAGQG